MPNIKQAVILLRIGLALVFFYAAAASFINPDAWIGYLPQFLRQIFPPHLLLNFFSVYEIFLGAWLLSGIKTFYAGFIVAATMFGIIVVNFALLDITFRDIGLLFAGLALSVLEREHRMQ